MKQNETLSFIKANNLSNLIFDDLEFTSKTPLRDDAFELSDDEKIRLISEHFSKIMHILGLDLNDDSLQDTPARVAKMYVKEYFSGLDPKNKPYLTLFKNKYNYKQMVIEKDISFYSNCEHHFVPFMGKAHIGYISNGEVVGLSKLNRIVDYFAKRPQVQERMTIQIANELKDSLKTEDIAVVLEAKHLCVSSRGIKDDTSITTTSALFGKFLDMDTRSEFIRLIEKKH